MADLPKQMPFDLKHASSMAREDFFISDTNQEAMAWLDKWPNWGAPALVIYGPPHAGKTHLRHIWQSETWGQHIGVQDLVPEKVGDLYEQNNNIAIDPLDAIIGNDKAEQALFHLYNLVKNEGGSLLICAEREPASWQIKLPDLVSRLKSCPMQGIAHPDDMLMEIAFVKLFTDRQMSVSPDVIAYILPRIERNMAVVHACVERIDQLSLADKRKITIPLVKEALKEIL